MSQVMIEPFAYAAASEAAYAAYNDFSNQMRAEQLPDDPPRSLAETVQELQALPPFMTLSMWLGYVDGVVVASGTAVTAQMEENQHVAQINVNVLPAYRRQGVGTRLLRLISERVAAAKRKLLVGQTNGRVAAGAAFAERIGASRGLEAHINQLDLAELDHDLIARWLTQAQDKADRFELVLWDGSYPEEAMDEVVALYDVMNQQPRGELEVEDFHYTAEQIRQMEAATQARGYQQWTLVVRDRQSGKVAGFTDVNWNPDKPEILHQGNTGVFPEYRGQGLGKWLKAAMLEKVIRERPFVKHVRTGNADANAPMLKINRDLGFKPHQSQSLWQVSLEAVQTYLASVD